VADDRGATAIEYGLICAMIAVVILGALAGTGGAVDLLWDKLSAIVTAFTGGGGGGGGGSGGTGG
jgi:pilus assembly protein Flp/PilA